jgi:guanine deaminase
LKLLKKNAIENIYNGGGPFASIIIDRDGFTIGKGVNQVTKTCDPTAHAEIVAIRDACRNINSCKLDGCILYSSSEPCPMCLSAIYWSGIKEVYYGYKREEAEKVGFIDSFLYDELNKDINERSIKMIRIKTNCCNNLNVFENWSKYDDKINY